MISSAAALQSKCEYQQTRRAGTRSHCNRTPALFLELAAVLSAAVALLILLKAVPNKQAVLFSVPGAFILVPLLALRLTGRKPLKLVPSSLRGFLRELALVAAVTAVALPLAALAIFAYQKLGMQLPLQPPRHSTSLMSLLAFQLLYAVIPEEVFFRGYLLSIPEKTTKTLKHRTAGICLVLTLNAAIFAAFHTAITGTAAAAWTFFPGLIFATIYLKTRSLLAPILMHIISNCFYITSFNFQFPEPNAPTSHRQTNTSRLMRTFSQENLQQLTSNNIGTRSN